MNLNTVCSCQRCGEYIAPMPRTKACDLQNTTQHHEQAASTSSQVCCQRHTAHFHLELRLSLFLMEFHLVVWIAKREIKRNQHPWNPDSSKANDLLTHFKPPADATSQSRPSWTNHADQTAPVWKSLLCLDDDFLLAGWLSDSAKPCGHDNTGLSSIQFLVIYFQKTRIHTE